MPRFACPFIRWWSFELFPSFDVFQSNCCEHLRTSVYVNMCF